jgi:hypothetical protein
MVMSRTQPAIDKRALSLPFEGIVNVDVDCRAQLTYVNDVVEVDRARRLKPDHGAPPVFSGLGRFPVMIPAAQLDGVWHDIRGLSKASDRDSQRR